MEPGVRVSIYEPPGNLRCGDVWCSKCQSESSISFHFTSVTLRQRPGEPSATGNRERNGVDKDITERERGLNSQCRGKKWHPSGRPTCSFLLSLSLFFIMPLCGGGSPCLGILTLPLHLSVTLLRLQYLKTQLIKHLLSLERDLWCFRNRMFSFKNPSIHHSCVHLWKHLKSKDPFIRRKWDSLPAHCKWKCQFVKASGFSLGFDTFAGKCCSV